MSDVAPAAVVTDGLLRDWPLPRFEEGQDKNDRGEVLVVGGSVPVPGAVILSGLAALRAGAGKLQLATVDPAAVPLGVAVPEALVLGLPMSDDGGIDPSAIGRLAPAARDAACVLIGPGMVDPAAIARLVRSLVDELAGRDGPTLVVDAGAVTSLGAEAGVMRQLRGRVIVTPNEDELAELAGDLAVDGDTEATACALARELGCVVAVRGWIVAPDGRRWRHEGGTVGLATSGSGDVLAGIVAGLAARGADPAQAAVWGVEAHSRAGSRLAGRVGGVGFLARELVGEIPGVLAEIAN